MITLKAPAGVGSVLGNDGQVYAVVSGNVTVPPGVANGLYGQGYYLASSAGATGATAAAGAVGATGATGADGATGATGAP